MATSDIDILRAAGDPIALAAMELLLAGPASQKEIGSHLDASSAQLSRSMALLESLGIVRRERSHGPYRLLDPDGTADLLLAAAQLGVSIHRTQLDESQQRLATLRQKRNRGRRNGNGT
jgi:DNA-binding transcriptional ArsR family regulator